eukprot:scaffold177559_cov19-Prasinocladus_malaysianus.AAC.1
MASVPWRLELFLKDSRQIPETASFLASQGFLRVNLPNKNRNEPTLATTQALIEHFRKHAKPNCGEPKQLLDVCPHFALK